MDPSRLKFEISLTSTDGLIRSNSWSRKPRLFNRGRRTLGGATRLSQGKTEDGYKLYDAMVVLNGNRKESIDMKFHVDVIAVGLLEQPVTIKSPDYQVTWGPGKTREIKTLKW